MEKNQSDKLFDYDIDDIVNDNKVISKIQIILLREKDTGVIHCCVKSDNSKDLDKDELEKSIFSLSSFVAQYQKPSQD